MPGSIASCHTNKRRPRRRKNYSLLAQPRAMLQWGSGARWVWRAGGRQGQTGADRGWARVSVLGGQLLEQGQPVMDLIFLHAASMPAHSLRFLEWFNQRAAS
ncbi:hypothetical protein BT67DRAFT_79840 [Trichocladium antarcticum]|uniref:Uncharacterized protein n=1 Tax=Trichocladium antarcticum TaxID=1450529 RepID=A0AAN6UIW4_9PEZI|nr:hypothetical protein BT67DRAFT_79840 [Trichocladium antarcticum]